MLAATLPDYFKLTAVVTHVPQPGYAPSSFSFKCANGVITLLGPGDLHRDTVDTKLRVVALQVGGSNLTLSLYPDKDYFDSYFSLYPAYQIIGACIALVIITGVRERECMRCGKREEGARVSRARGEIALIEPACL